MADERDPNSKNLFYVDPAKFPITNSARDSVDLDESTGKFTFEILSGGTLSIDADVGEPVAGKAFLIYVQRDLLRSIEYVRVQTRRTNGWFQQNFDDTNIKGNPTLSGEDFAFWRVSIPSNATSTTVTISMAFINSMVQYAGPQGIAFTLASEALTEWESAYREAKIDLDPIFSSKLITVGQLSRLIGSGTASGAQADKLLTMGQLARLTGKQAPAEDKKDKLVTVGQAYSVV